MERTDTDRRGGWHSMTRLVALTGATGFIGGNLKRDLLKGGTLLRLLTRRPPPASDLHQSIEWVQGDLSDGPALKRLVQDASHVVHCAGTVRGASEGAFHKVNAEGTRLLAEAAAEQDPQPRFLLLSSLAAREPQLSWYAASKRAGEHAVGEASATMAWAVFRPTAVHGPGDKEMEPLFQAMRLGLLPVLGAPEARITLLHVEDLVRAMILWLEHPEAVRGIFELHDGHPDGYDWPGIAHYAAQVWGRPVRRIPIPGFLLTSLATMNLYRARLLGSAPMLTPGKARELRHPDWRCDNTPLSAALGWKPTVDLSAALHKFRDLDTPPVDPEQTSKRK